MALLANLKADTNNEKIDLEDVYIRIDQVMIQPKYGLIKVYVEGYISDQVKPYINEIEQAQVDYAQHWFGELKSDIVSADLFNEIENERMEVYPAPFTQDYPVSLFHELYTVNMSVLPSSTDVNDLFPALYEMIKTDERLENVRDA